ncbi:MAG: GspE/PulE family protein [Planctomycetota bacterium]
MKATSYPIQKRTPLGELLIAEGLITAAELEAALDFRQERGIKLGQALVALHLVTQSDLANALRAQGKIHCIHLTPWIVQRDVAELLGEERSRSFQAVAVNRVAGIVTVAMEDPTEIYNVDAISVHLNCPVFAVHAEPAHIEECIETLFRKPAPPIAASSDPTVETETGRAGDQVRLEIPAESDDDMACLRSDEDVVQMVRALLDEAFVAPAASIHFEPKPQGVQVRFRVDGGMTERVCLARGWLRPMLARLKALANLDPAVCNRPQRGQARAEIRGHPVDLLVSTVPSLSGESAVVKLRDLARKPLGVEELGLRATDLASVSRMIECGDGLVIVAGPPGHGRTTTLYALAQHLQSPRRKIVTVEDPVEQALEGITQISIDRRAGLGFVRGLRAAVRQDPDVLLIDEVRDAESGEVALETANSGHLVLASMGALSTVDVPRRLCDLGVPPFHVSDALRGVISQRLVRRLCPHCKRGADPRPEILDRLGLRNDDGPFFEGRGCAECANTGFRGRLRLYEILLVNPELAEMIRFGREASELRTLARTEGMITLREDGIHKALAGETSLAEVYTSTWRE